MKEAIIFMSNQPIDKVLPGGVGVKRKSARTCCNNDQEGMGERRPVRFSSAGIMKAAEIFNM